MSVSAAMVLIGLLAVVAAIAIQSYRRRTREDAGPAGDVAAAQRNYLAANWSEVEAAARRGGMNDAEIAEVRRKLLGV